MLLFYINFCMRSYVFFAFSFSLLFSACTRTTTVTCQPGGLTVYAVGFNNTDFGTGSTLTRYKSDGVFDSVIDSGNINFYLYRDDTFTIWPALYAGYDYKIRMRGNGRVFGLTNIKQGNLVKETFTYNQSLFGGDRYFICYNGIVGYNIDGTAYTHTPDPNHNDFAVIVK